MAGKQQQTEKFLQVYQQLNAQQQKAVDTIEGPVMVIAGPGTGKTQILSARIGKILLETDARPENILCLTYTDAGVVAMRRRLLNFIGPDAYKVNIYTFHAFCNDVIQENLSLFEKNILDPISDLERIEFFKELIDGFPKNHPLKRYRGDVYFEINNLQSLFSNMKREGWTPEFINSKIDQYIDSLPMRDEYIAKRAVKDFKKGDVRTDKIAEEKEKMEKLRAAVSEFERFQQLMRQRNRYDFDDMINWVLRAFEENKPLLNRYQEQYLYILVDEYQDTSGTQNRLVELLINYWDQPNVFVVGDDDQSIYRFQGANIENMGTFMERYSDLLVIVLENNYRSTQPILDISTSLISRNNDRLIKKKPSLNLTKDLVASNIKIKSLTHLPVIREYETQKQEMIDITLQVEALLAQGVLPGRISVLYKENKYGEELAHYFRLRGIPLYSKRSINVLDDPLAQKILLLFRYLSAEHDTAYGGDEMLFELLHFNWFHIPPVEIARLSIEVAGRQFSDNKTSIRQLLLEKSNEPPKDLFSKGMLPQLKQAGVIIEKLIAAVPNMTLQGLFEFMIREAGILAGIMQSEEKIFQMQLLTALFDFVKEETRRKPTLSIHAFIDIIDLMEKEGISLPMVQVSGSDKGVNLLTAHGSKGLEFEYVFVAGCNASSWEKKRKPGGGYTLPDTMFDIAASSAATDFEELRRLFYVALTRAEQHLILSYCRFKNDGKELEPSMFIAELQEQGTLQSTPVTVGADVQLQFQALVFDKIQAPEIEKIEDDFVSNTLDKFVMNVTALNNYLKCPLEFYFKNLVRIPSPKNEATEFGSAVHHALQRLFEKMQLNKQFGSLEDFIADFNWYMHRHRESFTREQFKRRLEYGVDVLTNYYNKYIHQWNTVVAVERNIRNVVVKEVPLKGKLDKLEFEGKEVNVVDYKTGDPDKARDKLLPPGDKNPVGGDYWRQAVFYKILVDGYEQRSWQVVSTEFDFVEPDKKKEYQKRKVVIRPEDITTVTQQISDVWQKIQGREFYTGCGKEDCHWCNFVKTNDMAIALHELEDEE